MSLAPEQALHYYKQMLRIRLFERKLEFLFTRGKIHGTVHLSIGQEAIAVGVCSALQKDDVVTSTHRGHGHALAKGLHMGKFLAELQGKENGFCSGRGGTQHVVSMEDNFIANGITGGTAVTGTGIALAFKMQNKPKVVVSFFGDGAINEGHLHESLNLAAIWQLPIIYVCENNLYAMSTNTKESMIMQDIHKRVDSYGIKTCCIDGNDLELVSETTKEAVAEIRAGRGPIFVECKTYRQSGHSKNDQRVYRTREEEAEWKKKDPILKYEQKLIAFHNLSSGQLERIKQETEAEVEQAMQFAEQGEFPREETILHNLWG